MASLTIFLKSGARLTQRS